MIDTLEWTVYDVAMMMMGCSHATFSFVDPGNYGHFGYPIGEVGGVGRPWSTVLDFKYGGLPT